MIPSKFLSAVAFLGAIFLSSASAASHPKCYKCPQKITEHVGDKDVPFDFADDDDSHGVLECL